MLLAWGLARHMTGRLDVAWLTGAVVATSFGYFSMARSALPDLPLTFFITLGIWATLRAIDADRRAVRISVHLDTTDEQLVRADSTVPLLVEIGDATVFDNLTPAPAPAQPTGWKARLRRLARRTARSGGGKCRQEG